MLVVPLLSTLDIGGRENSVSSLKQLFFLLANLAGIQLVVDCKLLNTFSAVMPSSAILNLNLGVFWGFFFNIFHSLIHRV